MRPLFYTFFFLSTLIYGQQAPAFQNEVLAIGQKYDSIWDANRETIVFTGSSSIRMWKDLETRFPGHQIVNSGFGGSQASDLLQYQQELITRFNPKKVFIYEGDNDIVLKKNTKEIIETTHKIISNIKERDSSVQIILISAKPSISRWHLKRKYKRLNRQFQKIGRKENNVHYADVWGAMLDGRKVRQDIFLDDDLHMNTKGYDLWYAVILPFMDPGNTDTTTK
ncbi:MAG TPA: GDSL-type esterase/lipase family protein [Arenibacter sp.]|nr:GDSL-type esterase/lipase family protein [Arenibacter sp.]